MATILLLTVVASASAAPVKVLPSLVLERIVVVERHGVRAPTKTADALSKYSAQRWPDWPVGVGELTAHGAANVSLMGAWLRADYARRGLWAAEGCPAPGDVFVWADGQDQRTRVSAEALIKGAFPACGLSANQGPEGAVDPLFSAASAGRCPIDPARAQAAVLGLAKGDLDHPGPGFEAAKSALASVLGAPAVCADTSGACFLSGHSALRAQGGELKMDGPLGVGSTLTESLLLEYAEGMPEGEVGWGRAGSADKIAAIMPLHNIEADLMRRTPYIAEHNGALLARAVLAALEGRSVLPGQGAAGGKFVAIVGHDTNLSNLAGILGVDWTLAEQPDKTPPDAAMVFELWRDPASGARYVQIALVYQTLDDLRHARPLNAAHPAGRTALDPPGCAEGPKRLCAMSALRDRLESKLPANCGLN